MITTTEKKFLKNFTTIANVLNNIDEDGILKIERAKGDLIVMSAEKFDQIAEETLSILAMLEGIQGCDGNCEYCDDKEDCPLEEMMEDEEPTDDDEGLCTGCPRIRSCHCRKAEPGYHQWDQSTHDSSQRPWKYQNPS